MEVVNVNSNCPNCGAPVDYDQESQAFICKYCSSVIAVIPKNVDNLEVGKAELPVLRVVEPELTYKANHQIGSNSQGGHLWITNDEVVFKPHSLNFGPLGKRYIRIQDVIGYKKGFLTQMSIFTKSGYEMELVVWKKDEIINEIEARRVEYFQHRGLPVPPLQYNDGVKFEETAYGKDDVVPAENINSNSGCLGIIVTLLLSMGSIMYALL